MAAAREGTLTIRLSRKAGGTKMSPHSAAPGQAWLAMVTAANPVAFARALSDDVRLSASVLPDEISGADRIHAFFEATRAMYGRIAFTRETRTGSQCLLEWKGSFHAVPVEGVTILDHDAANRISHIRIFHLPYGQVAAFADELALRLPSHLDPTGHSSCT